MYVFWVPVFFIVNNHIQFEDSTEIPWHLSGIQLTKLLKSASCQIDDGVRNNGGAQ